MRAPLYVANCTVLAGWLSIAPQARVIKTALAQLGANPALACESVCV